MDTGSKIPISPFTVAVASGKGGTGKTSVAVALSIAAGEGVQLLDCDVEEPNSEIFLRPGNMKSEIVTVPVPSLNENKCTGCGKCSGICAFNALAFLGKPVFFQDMCHGCGLCMKMCPEGAIIEMQRNIGTMQIGDSVNVRLVSGCLKVGVAMATPLIRCIRSRVSAEVLRIIDCPPGTACQFMASVRDVDFVLLVAEPTRFGLHDMILAIKALKRTGLNFGVLVNKSVSKDDCIGRFCKGEKINLLMRIPEERKIAEAYSRGIPLLESMPELKQDFIRLIEEMKNTAMGDLMV